MIRPHDMLITDALSGQAQGPAPTIEFLSQHSELIPSPEANRVFKLEDVDPEKLDEIFGRNPL